MIAITPHEIAIMKWRRVRM